MNIITNHNLIKRNSRIGSFTTLAALGVLGFGMYTTFTSEGNYNLPLAALVLGFILSQIGLYFGNRWGRRPRPDQIIDQQLKGLGRDYTVYHYASPVSHLLIGPAGIWVLLPQHQSGTFTFSKDRWRQKSRGLGHAYMRIFGQEGLGRPDLEAESEISSLKRFFTKKDPEVTVMPNIQALVIFTSGKAEIAEGDDQPTLPAIHVTKLKDFVRKQTKNNPMIKMERDWAIELLPKIQAEKSDEV